MCFQTIYDQTEFPKDIKSPPHCQFKVNSITQYWSQCKGGLCVGSVWSVFQHSWNASNLQTSVTKRPIWQKVERTEERTAASTYLLQLWQFACKTNLPTDGITTDIFRIIEEGWAGITLRGRMKERGRWGRKFVFQQLWYHHSIHILWTTGKACVYFWRLEVTEDPLSHLSIDPVTGHATSHHSFKYNGQTNNTTTL